MCESTILVKCFHNRKFLRTKTYMKYVGNKAVIVPLDVLVEVTFDQLLFMIYSRTSIDKEKFHLVLNL